MPKVTVKVPTEVQTLPLRLMEAMSDAHLNQPELSRRTGIAQSAISRLCSLDKRTRRKTGGSLAHIVILAEALGVRVGWLAVAEPPKRAPGARPPIVIDADAVAQSSTDVAMRPEKDAF